jgi:hypothetical protein
MKRALSNIFCDNKQFIQGQIYTNNEVLGLDPNDFEDITEEEVVEEKPQSMTTESLKPKRGRKPKN